ncbi:MAG: UDP-N-acetylmuramoyl-L-alanine--D-glutamate ligase [Aquisalinus sp.]|nr:UDP-N-acetylmuramoyl-L-alanine--D-glutamate ligase [Aquisalinus sp.]
MTFNPDTSRIILHGLGVEGRAALAWLAQHEIANITVIDSPEKFDGLPSELKQNPTVSHQTESHWLENWHNTKSPTLYLRSPGIPPANAVFQAIQSTGIPHTTPTGYWLAKHAPRHIITITGTKGKSSTASLTAHLLRWAGRDAREMGNIGRTPFEEVTTPETICVLELSSYMMHDLPRLDAFHAVTNIYKEHTDWHGTHAAYRQDKLRSFLQVPPSRGILPAELLSELPSPDGITTFEAHARIEGDTIAFGERHTLTPANLHPAFSAPSMLLALRASIAICLASTLLQAEQIADALTENLATWPGLPSRQYVIPTTDGITWVDDALATVPEATLSALTRWQEHRIHLLLGGADRGQQFDALLAHCSTRDNIRLYAFGQTAARLKTDALSTFETLESMVKAARQNAAPGDIILFSPAAPSAPPNANYLERSRIFQSFAPQG